VSFVVVEDISSIPDDLYGAVIALGVFDGVHLGHRRVLSMALDRANVLDKPSAVVTFDPNPRDLLNRQDVLFQLTSLEIRSQLVRDFGLDAVFVVPFTRDIADLSPSAFIDQVLVGKLKVGAVAVGKNFFFGKGQVGSSLFLQTSLARLGVSVCVVDVARAPDGSVISSTSIRAALAKGDIKAANALLGCNWYVSSTIERCKGRGTRLGFPTVNMRLHPGCKLAHGVYSVLFDVCGTRYPGVSYFGARPQFEQGGAPMLEVHAFGMSRDVYGCHATVTFVSHIRPEMTFPSTKEFIDRLHVDIAEAKRVLGLPSAFDEETSEKAPEISSSFDQENRRGYSEYLQSSFDPESMEKVI